MSNEQVQFLNLQRPPGRLNVSQAAWFLGFQSHDIPILMKARLLKPLGNPTLQSVKYFSLNELEVLRNNRDWYSKACDVLARHWQHKNGRKSFRPPKLRLLKTSEGMV